MKKLLPILLLFFGYSLFAQQDAQYTQYMFNKLYFNPAYAGSKRMLNISGIYRKQWIGIEGAPQTQTFNIHAPILNQRVGLGLSVTNDVIGFLNSWNIETSYAYRIPVNQTSTLSIGMRGSVNVMQMRWDQADPTQVFDNAIAGVNSSKAIPNFGFGLYYDNPRYFVGFSIPHLFNSMVDFTDNGTNPSGLEPRLERHFFLMGGLILPISKKIQFQPSVMFKHTPRTPFDMDLNMGFVFFDRLFLGATYRLGDSVDAIFQYAFSDHFKVSAAYDFTLTRLQRYNSGSFEVMLEFNIGRGKNLKLHNPRFF